MSKGFSNFHIDDLFKDEEYEELKKFTWVYIQ